MSTTPHDPRTSPTGDPGHAQPLGQGAVNGAPQDLQYGQAGGKYGTTQYNPGQYTGTMERPATVDRLLKLTMISLALYVLSGILGMIANMGRDYSAMAREAGLSGAQADQYAHMMSIASGPVGAIISLLIGIGLYLLVRSGLAKGRNWARILGTVLAAIAILSGLFSLFGMLATFGALWGTVLLVMSLAKIVVDILWIVTAFRAPTSAWFAQNRARR